MGAIPEDYPTDDNNGFNTAFFTTQKTLDAAATRGTAAVKSAFTTYDGLSAGTSTGESDHWVKVAAWNDILFSNFLMQAKLWPKIQALVAQGEREAIKNAKAGGKDAAGKYLGGYPQAYESWNYTKAQCKDNTAPAYGASLVAMPDTGTAGNMSVNICKQLCIDAGNALCDGIEYIHGNKADYYTGVANHPPATHPQYQFERMDSGTLVKKDLAKRLSKSYVTNTVRQISTIHMGQETDMQKIKCMLVAPYSLPIDLA